MPQRVPQCSGSVKQGATWREQLQIQTPRRSCGVQSLRQELAAAEVVVSELKAWLADAEAELGSGGPLTLARANY